MDSPDDPSLPFFAYGMFKPGQIAFFRLKELVRGLPQPTSIKGTLLLRDGLPIVDPQGEHSVQGVLLNFQDDKADEAYLRIATLEPDKHYSWGETQVGNARANVLLGRNPRKGSIACEEEWDGWTDPLFTSALDVVDETLSLNKQFDWSLKPLFRLQMAYLLLWSAIERYVSLRYHLGDKATAKVLHLASEPAFKDALQQQVKERREVHRADRPEDKELLDSSCPEKSLRYYYQIRSNITHRGKAVGRDHDRLLEAGEQLNQIFRCVLSAARAEANY